MQFVLVAWSPRWPRMQCELRPRSAPKLSGTPSHLIFGVNHSKQRKATLTKWDTFPTRFEMSPFTIYEFGVADRHTRCHTMQSNFRHNSLKTKEADTRKVSHFFEGRQVGCIRRPLPAHGPFSKNFPLRGSPCGRMTALVGAYAGRESRLPRASFAVPDFHTAPAARTARGAFSFAAA